MSSPQWQSAVLPARLSFLAIYNPSLGPTDETFDQQPVFYYSRAAQEARVAARKHARNDAAGGDAIREEENEKLRQIGLAQGMADFARSFSDGQPVDHIDTVKSRIVLHELESGWWILASIDLTRLPGIAPAQPELTKKGAEKSDPKPTIEYSSREVSPPALLVQQLVQAHSIFTLHHGPSLTELYVRLERDKFCSVLDRFWTRFSRTWDVLLYGNPATDIFSGLKLSSGGELGMGVGEEEWGSGERDVLEDLSRRTDGLVDLLVSRFGDPVPEKDAATISETEALPWLGSGNHPLASDGVIFGGINGIAKPSLRNVSLWMRQIYTYGEYAYGVRDNPMRDRRKRRKRNPPSIEPDLEPEREVASNDNPNTPPGTNSNDFASPSQNPEPAEEQKDPEISRDDAIASEATSRLGIPPPIVRAAENSLKTATQKTQASSKQSSSGREGEAGTTLGIPDQYMKYLTFGLSTLTKGQKQADLPGKSTPSSSKAKKPSPASTLKATRQDEVADADDDGLTRMDPVPDVATLQAKIDLQKYLEEKGHFVIGLKGDLDKLPDESGAEVGEELDEEDGGFRQVLRTLYVELAPHQTEGSDRTSLDRKLSEAGLPSARNDPDDFKRLQVLVYVHRPFMYCFLFKQRTLQLSMARFYKELHLNLVPIHKPLLSSTNVSKISQRIEDAQVPSSDTASLKSTAKWVKAAEPSPIYDLLYDPALLTVHTSIPNIPEPGTPAAEGVVSGSKDRTISAWTRIEALNVHSQILNTLTSIQRNPHEYERTSKTSRGWWVVWMKLPPSVHRETEADPEPQTANDANASAVPTSERRTAVNTNFAPPALDKVESDDTIFPPSTNHASTITRDSPPPTNRIAFLVRKASDPAPPAKQSSGGRAASTMWNALTLRPTAMADENTGGASDGWGPAALAGGIGFDARKYVEGLLSLNR